METIKTTTTSTKCGHAETTISRESLLERNAFKSAYDYFDYLVIAPERLQQTLVKDNSVLDQREHFDDNTLLHFIAEISDVNLTNIVEPYLTSERVAAKNKHGKTVLDVLVTWADHLPRHHTYGELLSVYINYVNDESLASFEQHNYFGEDISLLDGAIRDVRIKIRNLEDFEKKYPTKNRTIGNYIIESGLEYLRDTYLIEINLLKLRLKIIEMKLKNPLSS